jgi:REP element-mobilizing transposase RayT
MAHTFTSSFFHCIFSAKERKPLITPELQERLWSYIGGIARSNKMKAIAIGGVEDHIHILLSIPASIALAKALQLIKTNSSKWVHEEFPHLEVFGWQEGYGAFSIGKSQVDATVSYIQNQAEHHRKVTFKQEFLAFLDKHEIEYDLRYLWD